MSRPNQQSVQTHFTSGEISPYSYGRIDMSQYNNSARQILNAIVRPQGGLLRRSGTTYVSGIANSANNAVLVPFVYSNTDAYVIELGAGYYRFYRNGAQVLSSTAFTNGSLTSNITGWTTNDSGTGTAAWNSANGGSAQLSGGSSGVGAIYQALSFIGTNAYTVTINVYTNSVTYSVGTTVGASDIATGTLTTGIGKSFTFTPTTEGTVYIQFSNSANNNAYVNTIQINNPVYQISNPFTQNEISAVRWFQSYDTLYLCHNNHPPFYIKRSADAQWTRTTITFIDGPYYTVSDLKYGGVGSNITISMSGTTGSVTATASASLFVSTDVGRLIRYRSVDTAEWWWGTITAFSSATSVTVAVSTIPTDGPAKFDASGVASNQWRLGYFSATTGYPGLGTIWQQRTWWAVLPSNQQSFFSSVTGDLYNMQEDDSSYEDNQVATSAMVYTIADNENGIITAFSTLNWFFCFTSGGVWLIDSSTSPGGPLTPETIYVKKVVSEAASTVPPAVCRTSVLFPHLYGKKLLEVTYSWASNLYIPTDLAVLAEQRTQAQIQWCAVATTPNYLVWCLMGDGTLSCCTYYKEQQITAWHQHIIGGTYNNGNAQVMSICVIPGTVEDQLWMIVKRTINGTTAQYVEYLNNTFLLDNNSEDGQFLDSMAEYSGTSTTTLTGLTWLVGQTVTVFGNGGVVPTTEVVQANGSVTLQSAVTQAWVGLPYMVNVQTNTPVINEPSTGPTRGRLSRIYEVDVEFYNSYGGKIGGTDTGQLATITEYGDLTLMGNPITLQSGITPFKLFTGYGRDQTITIQHSLPTPLYISSIVYRISPAQEV